MTSFVLYQLIEITAISLVIFGLTQKLFTYQYNVISIREISEIFFQTDGIFSEYTIHPQPKS